MVVKDSTQHERGNKTGVFQYCNKLLCAEVVTQKSRNHDFLPLNKQIGV